MKWSARSKQPSAALSAHPLGGALDQLAAFKQEQWDAVEITIGRHSVLTFDIVTPRESVMCLVWAAEDGRLFQTSASDSYSAPLAEEQS